jgi:hypothetical protein
MPLFISLLKTCDDALLLKIFSIRFRRYSLMLIPRLLATSFKSLSGYVETPSFLELVSLLGVIRNYVDIPLDLNISMSMIFIVDEPA